MVAPGEGGGMHGCSGGACMVAVGGMHGCCGGCAWLLRGVCMVAPGGACVVALGGMRGCSWGGVCGFIRGACVVLFGGHAWFYSGVCMVLLGGGMCGFFSFFGYNEIQSMSGRYASYWNAFLFLIYEISQEGGKCTKYVECYISRLYTI